MKSALLALSAVCGILLVGGCVSPWEESPYQRQDFAFKELSPPTENLTGRWRGTWTDPARRTDEDFVLDLKQNGNALRGKVEFMDRDFTRAAVTGQVSGAQVSLFCAPYDRALPKTSWVGTARDGALAGTWYQHGPVLHGDASTGPWMARAAKSGRK